MKNLFFVVMSVLVLSSCTRKASTPKDLPQMDLSYRGIQVGIELAQANLDSILANKSVLEIDEDFPHIDHDGLDGKTIVAQFRDSILTAEQNIIAGVVSVYAYRNKISDVVFSVDRTDYGKIIKPLEDLYTEKYGNGVFVDLPSDSELFGTRAKDWNFKDNCIHIYMTHYIGPSGIEYSEIVQRAIQFNRTEIIYRDNALHLECSKIQEEIEQRKNDSIQQVQDSIKNDYEKKKQSQDI